MVSCEAHYWTAASTLPTVDPQQSCLSAFPDSFHPSSRPSVSFYEVNPRRFSSLRPCGSSRIGRWGPGYLRGTWQHIKKGSSLIKEGPGETSRIESSRGRAMLDIHPTTGKGYKFTLSLRQPPHSLHSGDHHSASPGHHSKNHTVGRAESCASRDFL